MKTIYKIIESGVGLVEISDINRELENGEILVKGKLCGFCKSDIDTILGFNDIPIEIFGHEGIGIVEKTNSDKFKVGDFVATYGDGCYSDYYIVSENKLAKINELTGNFIVQPLATMINVGIEALKDGKDKSILINGTGSNAILIAKYFKLLGKEFDFLGSHNIELMKKYGGTPAIMKEYDVVIEISGKQNAYNTLVDYSKDNGLFIAGANPKKEEPMDLFKFSWKAIRMVFPSPRSKDFEEIFKYSADLLNNGELDLIDVFQKGYDRNSETDLKQAMEDRLTHKYVKAYLYW